MTPAGLPIIYWAVIALMMIGLYAVIARDNLVKKVIGLNIVQAAAILFYIALGKVHGGTAPVLVEGAEGHGVASDVLYSNPVPHVLMLTAIVVGVATTALALSLVVRIHGEYGSSEEDEIRAQELKRS
jgi:multicomponent Na+:H+ antiporter subunit C